MDKKCSFTNHYYTNNFMTGKPDEGQFCWCGKQEWSNQTNIEAKYLENLWHDWRAKKITFRQFLQEIIDLLNTWKKDKTKRA